MPELPEVENVAQALRHNLLGRRLTGMRVRFPGILAQSSRRTRQALVGKQLERVHRHGKYLLLTFGGDGAGSWDGDSGASPAADGLPGARPTAVGGGHATAHLPNAHAFLMIHLRMTGQIFILDAYRPDKHVHLTLDFDGLPVHYRDIRKFGRFTLVDSGERPSEIDHIGPDMLEVRFPEWHDRMSRRQAPIKSLLLDQGIASGLGNIYVDEALFRVGIHPLTAPHELTRQQLHDLFRAAKSVLRLAIRHGGTTFLNFTNFQGQPGNFRRKLRVYQRTGEPCRRCGREIERVVVAGRSSHYCPSCQPSPM